MLPKFTVLLLSGGLDSVTALYWLQSNDVKVHAVLFDYKQRHVQELTFAKGHCHRLGVLFTTINVPQLYGSELTDGSGGWVVPNRNSVMLDLAVNLAVHVGADSVIYGANKDDAEDFPDCRPAFVEAFNRKMVVSEIPVEVCAPFINQHKAWIAALARDLKVPTNDTWSCYRGGATPCGTCPACLKLNAALA